MTLFGSKGGSSALVEGLESWYWVSAGKESLWKIRTEDSVLAVVGVGLFGGFELVELEYVVDELLLAGGRCARWEGTLR